MSDERGRRHPLNEGQSCRWESVWDKFSQDVYGYVRFRLRGEPQEAEDLTSQTFLRAMEVYPDLTSYPNASQRKVLCAIAHNLLIDLYRRNTTRKVDSLDEPIHTNRIAAPDILTPDPDVYQRWLTGLGNLTDLQREVAILKFQRGLSTVEIARITGQTDGAVKLAIHRARIGLRRAFRPEHYQDRNGRGPRARRQR